MFIHLAAKNCPTVNQPVKDLAEASKLFQRYRDQHGFGGSAARLRCGYVYEGDPEVPGRHNMVARVSYNGRVWGPGPWQGLHAKPLMEAQPPDEPAPKYYVFNETDGIYAHDEALTRAEAECFMVAFRERYARQGYYAAASGDIPISDLRLALVPEKEARDDV
jgi:hypothetical protein